MIPIVSYPERLLQSSAAYHQAEPLLTIAIPHYKHRRHLQFVLTSILAQTYDNFEIVISDDQSPDDSVAVIPPILAASGRAFRYYQQPTNLGYDGNVRFCLAASRGRYILLLGNDDALATTTALHDVIASLHALDFPEVAVVNYRDWETGAVTRRVIRTGILGTGPDTAVGFFRSFSFVSGIIFERAAAARHETERWDGSIYYQIYLACRITAAGGRIAALNQCVIDKDVHVDGRRVFNYVEKWSGSPRSFQPRHTGIDSVLRVTVDAIAPFVPEKEYSALVRRVATQLLTITYPFWLFEYRRIADWSFAVGVARGLWPGSVLAEYALTPRDRLRLWLLFVGTTLVGLSLPAPLFNGLRDNLALSVRLFRQRTGQR